MVIPIVAYEVSVITSKHSCPSVRWGGSRIPLPQPNERILVSYIKWGNTTYNLHTSSHIFMFFFFLFWAAPVAYGGSQARG